MKARDTKFEAGEIVITPAATAALDASGQLLDDLLARHQNGDWGDVTDQVRAVNERGLVDQFNLVSCYVISGQRLTVVTNRERTVTMVHVGPLGTAEAKPRK